MSFLEVVVKPFFALFILCALGGPTWAKEPAVPPACRQSLFPLVAGHAWRFKSGADEVAARVLAVRPGAAGETEITVEETYRKQSQKTKWTCTPAAGLRIAPESFFFAGEPGGISAAELKITARVEVSLPPDAKIVQDATWVEEVKGDLLRSDAAGEGTTHTPLRLEFEKYATVHPPDPVVTVVGEFGATKITFKLHGRAFDGVERSDLVAKQDAALWLKKGVGPVKLQDSFEKVWELSETNVGATP